MDTFTFFAFYTFLGGVSVLLTIWLTSKTIPKKSVLEALSLFIILTWFTLQVLNSWSYTVDDTYISLRYARNLYEGFGPVFNTDASPPVEGYSNFLWILAITPFFYLGSDILMWVKGLSLLLSVGNILLVYLIARRLSRRYAVFAPLLFVSFPQFALWTVGGLETPLYILLILTAAYLSSRLLGEDGRINGTGKGGKMPSRSLYFGAGILGLISFLIALTRWEGMCLIIPVLILLIYRALKDQSGKGRFYLAAVVYLSAVAILYVSYFAWRINFYQSLLPNMFYAKMLVNPISLINRLTDKTSFFAHSVPFIIIILLLLNRDIARKASVVIAFALTLFGLSFLSYREWMPGFRYALPALTFIIILSGYAFSVAGETANEKPAKKLLPILLVLIFIPQLSVFSIYKISQASAPPHEAIAEYLNENASEDETLALWDMGLIPYKTKLKHYYDIHTEGLTEPHAERGPYSVDYFLEKKPDYTLLSFRDKGRLSEPIGEVSLLFSNDKHFRNNYTPVFDTPTGGGYFILFKRIPSD